MCIETRVLAVCGQFFSDGKQSIIKERDYVYTHYPLGYTSLEMALRLPSINASNSQISDHCTSDQSPKSRLSVTSKTNSILHPGCDGMPACKWQWGVAGGGEGSTPRYHSPAPRYHSPARTKTPLGGRLMPPPLPPRPRFAAQLCATREGGGGVMGGFQTSATTLVASQLQRQNFS